MDRYGPNKTKVDQIRLNEPKRAEFNILDQIEPKWTE